MKEVMELVGVSEEEAVLVLLYPTKKKKKHLLPLMPKCSATSRAARH